MLNEKTQARRNLTPVTAKEFRRRVLRPVEGVFLFHPRALERLIHQHLKSGLLARRIPALGYYLIPREVFLLALEDENPDALSVIEGLVLPKNVILLPMPLARERTLLQTRHLFQNYWGQRFEAEVARAWQATRDRARYQEDYAAQGLKALLGETAFKEIRAVLEHDKLMILGRDDDQVCRQFIGMVSRLRYFVPGVRGCYFPSIRCWSLLDCWMRAGGVEAADPESGYPALLDKSRPGRTKGNPQRLLDLPLRPRVCRDDPDTAVLMTNGCDPEQPVPAPEAPEQPKKRPSQSPPTPNRYQKIIRACRQKVFREQARSFWPPLFQRVRALSDLLLVVLCGVMPELVPRLHQDASRKTKGMLQLYREFAFHRHIEAGLRADRAGDSSRALQMLMAARGDYRYLVADAEPAQDPVLQHLEHWRRGLSERFASRFINNWQLADELALRIRSLTEAITRGHNSDALPYHQEKQLIGRMGRSMTDSVTAFSQPQLFSWLLTFGYYPLRLPLPFQGRLKGLRALRATRAYLTRLPWSNARFRYHSETLERIESRIADALRADLSPILNSALRDSGLTPAGHRQEVAFRKIREELLDVIHQRWHIRFADVRDAIARNDLRLHDPTLSEIWFGDKLTKLDRRLGKAMPGVYRRGEFYIQGLQQLSSSLFGTGWGRHLTHYVIVPFGAALIALEVVSYLMHLLVTDSSVSFLTPWSVLALGILLNFFIYAEHGKQLAIGTWHGVRDFVTFVLYRGIQRLLTWEPIARLLRNHAVREISRYLLEPLLIGALLLLPAGLLLMLPLPLGPLESIGGDRLLLVFVGAGFLTGNFLRNTQPGRRILDAVMVQLVVIWNQFRYTFVVGLFQSILQFFARLMDGIDQALYLVDDWVRARSHESLGLLVFKSVIKPLLGGVSYLIQFYVTVLIEPQVNPIKHFPVVTVAHKLMLPLLPTFTGVLLTVVDPFLSKVVAIPFVTLTIFLLPGLFGFLVWELKENWRLYRANHSEKIHPVLVGRHGETLRTMLRRGFHSGTVPKAFDRLRKVLHKADHQGRLQPARLYKAEHKLLDVTGEIERLQQRELIHSLRLWCEKPEDKFRRVDAGELHVATSSLEMVVLIQPSTATDLSLKILLNYRIEHGELLAQIKLHGPSEQLNIRQRLVLRDELEQFLLRTGAGYRAETLDATLGIQAPTTLTPR